MYIPPHWSNPVGLGHRVLACYSYYSCYSSTTTSSLTVIMYSFYSTLSCGLTFYFSNATTPPATNTTSSLTRVLYSFCSTSSCALNSYDLAAATTPAAASLKLGLSL